MPLVDWLHDKWRDIRAERLRGEQSRQHAFESLNAQEKDRACQEIAQWLKQADIKAGNTVNTVNTDDWYYSQAQQKIAGFRWQLHRFNQPFIWLEKQIIEPLDFWSDRANVFQFFAKVIPIRVRKYNFDKVRNWNVRWLRNHAQSQSSLTTPREWRKCSKR